jgi:hypothetical protein
MTEANPPRHDDDHVPTEPVTAALPPAGEGEQPSSGRWWNRRVPLLITIAGLLLGCLLGAGVVGLGALVADRHDDRGRSGRGDVGAGAERGRDGAARSGRGDHHGGTAPPSASPASPAPAAS